MRDIRKLVAKMAPENLGWGYTKIRDALRTGLKTEIGRTTVADILAEEGIEPAPERREQPSAAHPAADFRAPPTIRRGKNRHERTIGAYA